MSCTDRSRRSPRAFTLVELIILVVIVAVVVAVMTPLVIRNRAESTRQACLVRMNGVQKALFLYVADCDDTLPMARRSSGAPTRQSSFLTGRRSGSDQLIWADLIAGYDPHARDFSCPGDPDVSYDGDLVPLSFAINGYFYRQPGIEREAQTGGAVGEVPNVGSKLLLVESSSKGSSELIRPDGWKAPDGSAIWERHNGANWIFGDSHAEHHTMPATWRDVATSVWVDPTTAAEQPFPQWIPWIAGGKNRW